MKITLDYLNDERKIIFEKLEKIESLFSELKVEVKKTKELAESKVSADEKIAYDIATKAKLYEKEILTARDYINEMHQTLKGNDRSIKMAINKVNEIETKSKDLENISVSMTEDSNKARETISKINILADQLNEKNDLINGHIENITKGSNEIKELLTSSVKFRKEIEDAHDEVMGYEYVDEESGETKNEIGFIDLIKEAYEKTEKSFNTKKLELKDLKQSTEEELDSLKEKYNKEFEEKNKKINSLLPGALTAGLSSAYATKKNTEKETLKNAKSNFVKAIWILIVLSVVPIGINIGLYFGLKFTFLQILENLPSTMLITLPIYLPVFWLAFSANKDMKLSRRLIEEYEHKEVLSKTYQGLAEQIKTMEEESSIDLKNKLLYNMVAVSAENPGKLITDYNKTDNPLMEMLDKSTALAESFEKLKNVPGFGRIAKYYHKREEAVKNKLDESTESAMNVKESLDETE